MENSIKLLENLLDYCAVKNKVISNNIANIQTENYKREDVEFKNLLEENSNTLLRTTESKHLRSLNDPFDRQNRFRIVTDDTTESLSGINNVNIEQEMAELAENTLRFKFASKKVSEYYKMIQKVISGGGRI